MCKSLVLVLILLIPLKVCFGPTVALFCGGVDEDHLLAKLFTL